MSYIDQITIGSSSYDIQDSTVPAWARSSSAPVESVNGATGIVTLTAADIGALSAPSSATADAVLAYNGTAWVADKRMVILSYGSSTWTDFINAYNNNAVIYCRASSNSNPASGAQTRMAFMAYVNSATPTSVEFQYYRSVSSHTAAQQGDQVFIYKLDKTAGWTVTVREAYTAIAVGTGLSSSYSNGVLTLTNGIASATADPLMDGTAAVGSSSKYAKEDHVHPVDTSRASVDIVYVGASEPSNPDVKVWLDTDEPGMSAVSSVNGATGTVVLDADDVGAMSRWELLWTNANPTSSFAAQLVSLDLTDYDVIQVFIAQDNNMANNFYQCIIFKENIDKSHFVVGCLGGKFTRRFIAYTANGINFSAAQIANSYGGSFTDSNTSLIPWQIWGVKGTTA